MRKASGEIKELTVFSTGRRPYLPCHQPPLSLDSRREPPASRAECSWGKGMKMGQDAEGDDPEVGPMIIRFLGAFREPQPNLNFRRTASTGTKRPSVAQERLS